MGRDGGAGRRGGAARRPPDPGRLRRRHRSRRMVRPMAADPPQADNIEHVFDTLGQWRPPAQPRSCTPISTPSTRRSSSCSTRRCGDGPSRSAAGWCWRRPTRRGQGRGAAGMPGWRARQLCPELQFVGGHFGEYQRLGDAVMAVFRDFTPVVERVSIDEAFLDVAGAARLFGTPGDIAGAIRRRVRGEIGLPISIGVARTKHLAKVASQVAKPDGLVVVRPGRRARVPRPAAGRPRLGGRAGDAAPGWQAFGNGTIGELAAARGDLLEAAARGRGRGQAGALAANVDPRRGRRGRRAKSVGAQAALGRRRATPELLADTFGYLADRVAGRLRAPARPGAPSRSGCASGHALGDPLAHPARRYLRHPHAHRRGVRAGGGGAGRTRRRSRGVAAGRVGRQPRRRARAAARAAAALAGERHRPGAPSGAARWGVDRSVDAIRERFGHDAVGYAGIVFAEGGGAPEGFRELAERDLTR